MAVVSEILAFIPSIGGASRDGALFHIQNAPSTAHTLLSGITSMSGHDSLGLSLYCSLHWQFACDRPLHLIGRPAVSITCVVNGFTMKVGSEIVDRLWATDFNRT